MASISTDHWELVVIIGFAALAVVWASLRWVFPTETPSWRQHEGDREDLL